MVSDSKKEVNNPESTPVSGDKPHMNQVAEKAPLGKRFNAAAIDYLITIMLMNTVDMLFDYAGYSMATDESSKQTLRHTAGVVAFAIASAYMLTKDCLLGYGQSIGKRLVGLRVVGPDGFSCSPGLSIKRNLSISLWEISVMAELLVIKGYSISLWGANIALVILLIEVLFIYFDSGGRRLGDKIAGTTTIICKNQVPLI
jgi:uncharacterized RDD family membrane protein YckC